MEKTQKKQRNYSVEFKLCAILDKLENGLNYFETVRKHWNLSTTAEANNYANRLKLWERNYLEGGVQGLMEKRRGKACGPGKGRPRKKPRPPEEENPLVAENRRLKMEIEYLKKLSALVLANERAKKNKHFKNLSCPGVARPVGNCLEA